MQVIKVIFLIIVLFVGVCSCNESSGPVSVIFDSDIAPDYDDVGALAILHTFADNGEVKILATVSSNAYLTTGPSLSVINTYFGRAHIPIGVVKAPTPRFNCPRLWAEGIVAKYPHAIQSNSEAWDALKLYRKILSEQPDTSVTIITVGTLTNISNLLNSSPDEYSSLNGSELITKKVKRLVSMAGAIDSSGISGYESNIIGDIPAAQNVFDNWPTPVTLSGFEIGVSIFTGMCLIHDTTIKNSPIKDAYQISLAYDGSTEGRYSWDQTAVLVAVKGINPYFNYRKLNFKISNDGKDSVKAGDRITYLMAKHKPEKIGEIIEELMIR